ncbi:hypothetical protein DJ71_19525 [Halorubrum sp. E3]|mgnify:FL=1|nr:hypothetical protein DJ71_19525 [Halorubrum sp. E3]OYR82776.1 hypothetical protein DJ72_08645 [Halorubrum distributum]
MGSSEADIKREIEIDKPQHKYQCLQLDTRGRVTIPKSVRAQFSIDPEDDLEYWVNLEITSIEVRDPSGGDGSA